MESGRGKPPNPGPEPEREGKAVQDAGRGRLRGTEKRSPKINNVAGAPASAGQAPGGESKEECGPGRKGKRVFQSKTSTVNRAPSGMPSPLPPIKGGGGKKALHSSIDSSGYSGENMDKRRGSRECGEGAHATNGRGRNARRRRQAGPGLRERSEPRPEGEAGSPAPPGFVNKGQPRAARAPPPAGPEEPPGTTRTSRAVHGRPPSRSLATLRPRVTPSPGSRGAGGKAGAALLGTHLEDQPRHLTRYSSLPCRERGGA